MAVILIGGLPSGPVSLSGSELLEIQNGTGPGASQQTTAALIAAIALRQSVQAILAGQGDLVIDITNPNQPKINIPEPVAGTNLSIDRTNPLAPVYSSTTPITGGIQAAYGSPGGNVLQAGNIISGIATANYNLTGWEIQCSPAGSIQLDLLVGALGGSPSSIIGTGNGPNIVGATSASSNALTGWTSLSVTRGSVIQISIKTVSSVEWFNVAFLGNRV